MQPLKWAKHLCNSNGYNRSINLKNGKLKGVEDLMICALTFLFVLFFHWGSFFNTKWDPLNGANCPTTIISFHQILWNTSMRPPIAGYLMTPTVPLCAPLCYFLPIVSLRALPPPPWMSVSSGQTTGKSCCTAIGAHTHSVPSSLPPTIIIATSKTSATEQHHLFSLVFLTSYSSSCCPPLSYPNFWSIQTSNFRRWFWWRWWWYPPLLFSLDHK